MAHQHSPLYSHEVVVDKPFLQSQEMLYPLVEVVLHQKIIAKRQREALLSLIQNHMDYHVSIMFFLHMYIIMSISNHTINCILDILLLQ